MEEGKKYDLGTIVIDADILDLPDECIEKVVDSAVRFADDVFRAHGDHEKVKSIVEQLIVSLYKEKLSEEQTAYVICVVVPTITGEMTKVKNRALICDLSVELLTEYEMEQVH